MSKRFKQVFPIFNAMHMRYPSVAKAGAKLFDIDNVAAYWVHHDKWDFDMRSDFGPLRLPYEWTWMEHDQHKNEQQQAGIVANGWMLREFQAGQEGRDATLREYKIKDHHPDSALIVGSVFWGTPHMDDHAVLSWVTESGSWITSACHFPPGSPFLRHLTGAGLTPSEAAAELRAMFNPVALAIGLANCRNIDVPELQTRAEGAKKRTRKNRAPSTEYRVIRLPGAPSNRVDGPAPTASHSRFHTVRGHFKTYTADKPLYGRLTGTWWWSPAVRGDRKRGEVVSTYKQ